MLCSVQFRLVLEDILVVHYLVGYIDFRLLCWWKILFKYCLSRLFIWHWGVRWIPELNIVFIINMVWTSLWIDSTLLIFDEMVWSVSIVYRWMLLDSFLWGGRYPCCCLPHLNTMIKILCLLFQFCCWT